MEKSENKDVKIDINKDSSYTSPIILFSGEKSKLQHFFQYLAVKQKMSPLSMGIQEIMDGEEKDLLWRSLLGAAETTEENFIFAQPLRNKIKEIRELQLSDNTLNCNKVKGFVRKDKETHELDEVLNRIRNSFAHGRIAKSGEYLIFEDKKNELTARIVLTFDVLEKWMNIINAFIEERRKIA